MATYTPPPYFPQQSLAPPDAKRYRRFKLLVILICLALATGLAGLAAAIWLLIRSAV
ncbi:MAG TPA: hypothetical protein VMM84_19850 [Pyrinomonadaceae bacterium]|nr:hypothetical protein [Pyrinomonadaceae bacterium]